MDDCIYWNLTHTPLGITSNRTLTLNSAVYSSLLQTHLCPLPVTLSASRFLVTDFNTGTVTFSLNHAPHISLYYSTHKDFSSLPDFQLSTELARLLHHLPTANSGTLKPILCCNCHLSRCHLLSVISQSSTLDCQFSRDSLNSNYNCLSHIAIDCQSVSKSWCRVPSGAHDQIFIIVWQLLSCLCGSPSLTRGRVCLFYMLLVLSNAVKRVK
jgi:hypothetical protein